LIAKCQAEGKDLEGMDYEEPSEVAQFQSLLDMLMKKLEGLETCSLFSMADEHLENLNISESDVLKLKPNCTLYAAETDSIGEDDHWSANGLYRHLCMLEGLVPQTNEAAARLWINAFFFRVASLLPGSSNSKIVLNIEQNVLPVARDPTIFSFLFGFVNFTAILTTEAHAQLLLMNGPKLKTLSAQDQALFVIEAKGPNQRLESHIPQAICEMYACARHISKTIFRGALTNGHSWIFLILILNEDGNGGKYFQSDRIQVLDVNNGISSVSHQGSSLIAAIIAHWIQHSHEEIGTEDYFELCT